VCKKLLDRSNLTKAQFETILLEQLGDEMAGQHLKREEMAGLSRSEAGISRGAWNRTLAQAKRNVSQAIHTFLLLGYTGLIETPSLSPFLEASDRLKENATQLREVAQSDKTAYERLVEQMMQDLEEAFEALQSRKKRDV
jgi:hypothetical protein